MLHPRVLKSRAIILNMRPFGEQDKIIDAWTEKSGRISGLAKSAQKSRKRFGGRLDYFSLVELHYQERPHSILYFIQSCDLLQSFENIKCDVSQSAMASYLCELILRMMQEKQPDEGLFFFFVQTLEGMNNTGQESMMKVLNFKLYFMKSLGLQLLLNRCCQCKSVWEIYGEYPLSFRQGGLLCPACRKKNLVDEVLSLALYEYIEGKRSFLSDDDQHKLHRILNSYLEYQYGFAFRSFQYLNYFSK
ncbi:MAG: DNA repair protein RecO [Deltaproteobacteria bacterium]|nr:DNA repair protein RecO [Deltaproteobacteria bacterium]